MESVHESIFALDKDGYFTTINKKGSEILGLPIKSIRGTHYSKYFNCSEIEKALKAGEKFINIDLFIYNIPYLANIMPIKINEKLSGCVITLRSKDEFTVLAKQLSYFQEYTNMLRAQHHEFLNKLHTLNGFLSIGDYDSALKYINDEITNDVSFYNKITGTTSDKYLIALLIGKYNYANEKGIILDIDENSSLFNIPEHISINDLIIILGNLVDNAIEASLESKEKKVFISFYDYSNELIFEVTDTGKGIPKEIENNIFEKGVSNKQTKGRGIGLYQSYQLAKKYGGSISYKRYKNETVFTVILPKEVNK